MGPLLTSMFFRAHDVVNAVLHAMAKARESKGGITEDANRAFDEAVETIASALKRYLSFVF